MFRNRELEHLRARVCILEQRVQALSDELQFHFWERQSESPMQGTLPIRMGKIGLRDVVCMVMDHLGIDVMGTPAVEAKAEIVKKPEPSDCQPSGVMYVDGDTATYRFEPYNPALHAAAMTPNKKGKK